jgi:hypothetical protein
MAGPSTDIWHVLRTVTRGGMATAVAVLSFAVGVWANAAIFGVG